LLSDADAQAFEQVLNAFHQAHGHRLVVLTLMQLEGYWSLEEYAHRTFVHWSLDSTDVLLLIVRQSGQMTLKTSSYVHQVLNHRRQQRILEMYLRPCFHQRDFEQGLADALTAIQGNLLALPHHVQRLPRLWERWDYLLAGLFFMGVVLRLWYRLLRRIFWWLRVEASAFQRFALVLLGAILFFWWWWASALEVFYWFSWLAALLLALRLYGYFPQKKVNLPYVRLALTALWLLGILPLIVVGGELSNDRPSFFQLFFVAHRLCHSVWLFSLICLLAWLAIYFWGIVRRKANSPALLRRFLGWFVLLLPTAYFALFGYANRDWVLGLHGLRCWLPGLPSYAPLSMLGWLWLICLMAGERLLQRL
jgi:uncharacterized membrane protein YgcG